MKNTKVIVPIILVLVGLGAGFFGGYQYRNYRLSQSRGSFAAGAGGASGTFQRFTGSRSGTGARAGGGAVTGSILSIDTNSMTVKLADGSTKIVILGGSTTYSNTASASQSDLKTGSNVMVLGTANSDGSVTATNVQINPQFARPAGSPAPSATP
ncbi:MAG: DUF5666 domain-containing protein [Candidatus Microgenomates bacterium]|jgi:hypothetical protein